MIDLPAVGINTVTHTYQVVQYGTSGSGQKLYYYSIKPKVVTAKTQKLLAGFAIHGWEDSYAKDGQVLVDIGNTVADYFASNQTQLYNFELIIIPRMNPDGLDYGTTNNGPGRCQTSLGIDINRDFDTNFVAQTDPRNKTGSVPFGSPEAKAIRDLIVAQKPSIVLDFHGWLDKTIGDPQLAKIIGDTMGITSTSQFTTGFNGYFAPWAGKYSQRTMLVEYPVSCALGSKAAYITKTQNALSKIMQTYSVMEPLPVITIDPYNTAPTNQNITVTARTDKGSLNRTSYTFTENGSFEFIANDGGSISKRTVTITNIDKKAPVVSGVSDGKSYQAPVRITFSDGAATLNGQAFVSGTTVAQNGSYSLTVTDAVGNKTIINFEIRNRGYELIDNILCGINPKTTVADLKSALTKEAWQDIILRNKDGKEITGGLVGTGMTLHMTRNEETMDCTILIYGDIDGNGLVDAIDMVYIKKHTLKIKRLTGLTLEAADTSHDGTVNVTDLVKMKTHLLKRAFISQYRNEKEILNP
ncbi:MAG: hypothetical protein BGN88_12400 [Clostridiales bacterium 43-6]|nr:MAG: hypothetical protein BGN88_12400 [Clostridiales bacterium 43-6]